MKRISLAFMALLILSFVAIRILSAQMESTDAEVLEKIDAIDYSVTFKNHETNGYNMRWIEIGDSSKPTAFFIHGSPGSYDNFETFFNDDSLLSHFQIVSIDRPGFGGSEKGRTVESIIAQAELIQPILTKYSSTPTVLIGWSYGGPLATALVGLYPELVQGMVLLASAASAEHEKIFFFNKPFSRPILNWMLPSALRVSNEEKLSHQQALRDMEYLYKNISIPVIQIHGDADNIVPVANGKYVAEKLAHNPKFKWIRNEKDDHFLPTKQKELIRDSILNILKE